MGWEWGEADGTYSRDLPTQVEVTICSLRYREKKNILNLASMDLNARKHKLSTSSEALRKILVKGQQVYSWQTGTFASQIHKN